MHLLETIPERVSVKFEITKLGIIDIPTPCFEWEGHQFGSCTYDGDEFLKMFSEFLCPGGDDQLCSLPISPGWYGSSEPSDISLGQLCPFSELLNLDGTYSLKIHLLQEVKLSQIINTVITLF